MGMYTEIFVNIDLKGDTPDSVIETLKAMCEREHDSPYLRDKPSRWSYLFTNGSAYTPSTACGMLDQCKYSQCYSLLGKGDIKNYEGEIEEFFDFIRPWSDDHFMGYWRYEEDELPTLVFREPTP